MCQEVVVELVLVGGIMWLKGGERVSEWIIGLDIEMD